MYYRSKRDDSPVIAQLQDLAERYPSKGIDTYYKFIRRRGLKWGRMRVLRVYRLLKLGMRRKGKKRLPARIKEPLKAPQTVNTQWAMDFMSDALSNGRKFRVLNIMDECSREGLAAYANHSIPAASVIRQLEALERERDLPEGFRLDNGPEWTSFEFTTWCQQKNIHITYVQPGRPMQNGFIERFNKTFREDVLDAYLFENLEQVNLLSEQWLWTYNRELPHGSLHDMTPREYAEAVNSGKLATRKIQEEFTTINSHNSKEKKSSLELS
jgi:putative transposase